MKVTMKVKMAGCFGTPPTYTVLTPGQVVDVSQNTADRWIAKGFATACDQLPVARANQ